MAFSQNQNKAFIYLLLSLLFPSLLYFLDAPIPPSITFLMGQKKLALTSEPPFFSYLLLVYPFTPYILLWILPSPYFIWGLCITSFLWAANQALAHLPPVYKKLNLLVIVGIAAPVLLFYPFNGLAITFSFLAICYIKKFFQKENPIHIFIASIFLYLLISTEKMAIALLPCLIIAIFLQKSRKVPTGPLLFVLMFPSIFFICVQGFTSLYTHPIHALQNLYPFLYLPVFDPSTYSKPIPSFLLHQITTKISLFALLIPTFLLLKKHASHFLVIFITYLCSIIYIQYNTANFDVEILLITQLILSTLITVYLKPSTIKLGWILILPLILSLNYQLNEKNALCYQQLIKQWNYRKNLQIAALKMAKKLDSSYKIIADDRKHGLIISTSKAQFLSPSYPHFQAVLLQKFNTYSILAQKNSEKDVGNQLLTGAYSKRSNIIYQHSPYTLYKIENTIKQ